MLHIVGLLEESYPQKRFTLDSRLVGDFGEILVETAYEIVLFEGLQKHHDGRTPDGRNVQIKSTMKDSLTMPGDHIPDYYLGIKIHRDGTFEELFNGPGSIAWEAVKNRKRPKTNLHSVSIKKLKKLNANVEASDRIPLRTTTSL